MTLNVNQNYADKASVASVEHRHHHQNDSFADHGSFAELELLHHHHDHLHSNDSRPVPFRRARSNEPTAELNGKTSRNGNGNGVHREQSPHPDPDSDESNLMHRSKDTIDLMHRKKDIRDLHHSSPVVAKRDSRGKVYRQPKLSDHKEHMDYLHPAESNDGSYNGSAKFFDEKEGSAMSVLVDVPTPVLTSHTQAP
jgi:hypothetical protein